MKTIILTVSVIFLLLIGTPIQSQMAGPNPSASNPSPPLLIATEQEVRQFFDKYIERYNKRDIDGFLRFFSLKAKQNQQDGLPEMRELYSDIFNRSRNLHISIEEMKINILQKTIQVKGRYTVNQVLKESGEKKIWKGDIRWVLHKEEGILKIISVDFRHSVPPTVVAERGPKPEEKPAGKAAVKSKTPVEAKKTSPQASPPLAKDEAAVKSKTPVEAKKTSPQVSPPLAKDEAAVKSKTSAEAKKTSPQTSPLLAKEEEVKRFFSGYIDRYNRKDVDGFLSLFSVKAVQNQKDELKAIRNIYTKFFDQSQELRYQTEGMKIEIYQNSAEVKARFRVDQRLKSGGEEKIWKGNIRWVLVKEDGNLKISSLDYQNEKSP